MVSNPRYLLKVGGNYYFRLRVPKHIEGMYCGTYIKKSLQTKDLKSALHKATILRQLSMLVFKQLEEEMIKKDNAKAILFSSTKKIASENPPSYDSASNSNDNDEDEMDNYIPPAGEYGVFKSIERQNKAVERAVAKAKGSVDDMMKKIEERLCNTSDLGSQSKELVKDLLEKFISEKMNNGSWDETTLKEYNPFISLFNECFSDTEISEITSDVLNDYRDNVLKKYPKRRNLYFAGKSLEEAIRDTTYPKISTSRVNSYLGFATSFFLWCEKRDYINKNPAVDLKLIDKRPQTEKRTRYNKQELEKIITDLSNLSTRGPSDHRRNIDRTWIVLIAMYSGFRQNEICQLYIDNIFSTDGIPCMQVVKDESRQQKAKNQSSYRTIPIHKTLLQLGFLNFVNQRRNSNETFFLPRNATEQQIINKKAQLFQSMNPAKSRSSYAKNLKNFYYGRDGNGGFNARITSRPNVTFHSFRHNFISALNNTSKVQYAVKTLVGHSHTDITSRVYTEEELKSLNTELNRLEYDFDLFGIFGVEPFSDEAIAEQIKELPVKE